MLSRLSVYWAPQHKAERPQDVEFIGKLQPYDVLILDPGVGDILDVHRVSPNSEIVLRYWALDDGRGDGNPGVYQMLAQDPAACAEMFVRTYEERITEILAEARKFGVHTLEREQLVAHGVNEPDTNHLTGQINAYTVRCCELMRQKGITFEALNFATGHPVHLVAGPGSDVDWSLYEPALEAIEHYQHYAVTHEYYNDLGIDDASVYPWHIGRADTWMPEGPERKIGEFGLEMLLNGRMNNHHGWQGIISKETYLDDIYWYMNRLRHDVVSVRIF